MILLDKYYALEKADNQYQLGIIDEQTKISIIKFLNSLPSAQSDNGYSDGFTDGYKRGLTDAQPDNQINLCDSCDYSYPDCPSESDDVIFGNGIGNDNICACNKYKPSAQPEIVRCKDCRYWEESETIGGKGYCKDMYGFGRWWKSEDFCSYAERRTNGC